MPGVPLSAIQIPLASVERGLAWPIARLKSEPEEIKRRTGLEFEATSDDLDDLWAAAAHSGGGRQFALVRHRHQPQGGTDILINERSTDPSMDLHYALEALRFERRELTWIHPDIRWDVSNEVSARHAKVVE